MKATSRKYFWPKDTRIQIRKIPNHVPVLGNDGKKPLTEIDRNGEPKRVTRISGYSWQVTVPVKVTGSRRERYQYDEEDKAREKAEQVAKDKREVGTAIFELKPQERTEAMATFASAKDLIPEGVTLLGVLTDASKALKLLHGHKLTLEAAARFAVERLPKHNKLVSEVVTEFKAAKAKRTVKGRPASPKYIADLDHRLDKFAKDFSGSIAEIEPAQIDKWVDDLKPRTRHNYLGTLRTLFRFAQAKQYFPRTVNPLEGVDGVSGMRIPAKSKSSVRMNFAHCCRMLARRSYRS